jgi:hypothetical protein
LKTKSHTGDKSSIQADCPAVGAGRVGCRCGRGATKRKRKAKNTHHCGLCTVTV